MSVIVCACVCAPTKTWTNMCEQSAVMLGLLFAFSSPIDQSSIREGRRLLWRKLWEFSCPGQFVSQIHNQASLLMNNTSTAERVFILYKRGSVKALDALLPWQFECFSTSLTVCVCVCYTPLILEASGKREVRGLLSAKQSNLSCLSGCADIMNKVLQLFPCIHRLFGHQSARQQLLATSLSQPRGSSLFGSVK